MENASMIPLHGAVKVEAFVGPRLLSRVLLVVQFSTVLTIADTSGAGIADFQEAMRGRYPILEQEVEPLIHITIKDGELTPQLQQQIVWRLYDLDRNWRISLTVQSIAIECIKGYQNRFDFADRAGEVIAAVAQHFRPAQRLRAGTRFINLAPPEQVVGACAPQLVSITGEPELLNADLAWRFPVDEGTLLLRSGIIPRDGSYDPLLVQPVSERTWYLDIDVHDEEVDPFEANGLTAKLAALMNRAHEIYIWAMTKQKSQVGENKYGN